MLLGGRAADLIGRRRVFVSGLVLFALASLAGGIAQDQATLIAARAVQGLGGAVIAPASLSILTATFEEGSARNRAVGVWGAMGAAGGSAGVLLGGLLTEALNWRWILFINVPIGLIAAVLAQRYVAEGRNPERARSFDLAGAVTATAGLSLLVFGIVRTSVTGWGSAQTLGVMAAGVVLLIVFVAIEGRFAKSPLMPLRIYHSRTLSASNLIVLLIGAAVFAMWFFVSLYLQQVLGYSPIQAGLAFLPMTIAIATCSTLASRMVQRFGAKSLLVTGMLLQTLGLVLFTDVSVGGTYLGNVLAPSVIVAIGMGLAFVPGHDHRGRRRCPPRGRARIGAGQHLAPVRRRTRPRDPGRDRDGQDQQRSSPRRRRPCGTVRSRRTASRSRSPWPAASRSSAQRSRSCGCRECRAGPGRPRSAMLHSPRPATPSPSAFDLLSWRPALPGGRSERGDFGHRAEHFQHQGHRAQSLAYACRRR